MKNDVDHRLSLWYNIVFTGGNSYVPGAKERLEKRAEIMKPGAFKSRVLSPPDREFAAFIGSSIIGNINAFSGMVLTRAMYEQRGDYVIHTFNL